MITNVKTKRVVPQEKPSDIAGSVYQLTLAAFSLLTPSEKRRAIRLVAALVLIGLADLLSLTLIMPVVSLVVDPELAQSNRYIALLISIFPGLSLSQLLLVMVCVTIVSLVTSTCLSIFAGWRVNKFGADIQSRVAFDLMQAMVKAPYLWFLDQNHARLVRFFHSDIVRWGRDYVQRFISLTQYALAIVLPLALMLLITPVAALMSLGLIMLLAVLLVRGVQPRIQRAAKQAKASTDEFVVVANTAILGAKDIKLACQENEFAGRFARYFSAYSTASASLSTWQVVPSVTLSALGQIALLSLAAIFWMQGLSQSEIAAQIALIVLVTSRVIPAANRFVGLYTGLWNNLYWVAEVVRIHEELRLLSPQLETVGLTPPENWERVEFDHVSFRYPNSEQAALHEVSVCFEAGTSVAIMGPSGAGKSTLIDLLTCLYEPESGKILVDQTPLSDINTKAWHGQIGYVPQSVYLIDDTIAANVALGQNPNQIDYDFMAECLRNANLEKLIESYPDGVHTRVGDRGTQLSGGQRQRVAIARALYQRPRLLVLDEATASLDNISEREIKASIELLRGKMAVVIIAHRTETVKSCDKVYVLGNGRKLLEGTFDDLLRNSQEFRALAGQQTT